MSRRRPSLSLLVLSMLAQVAVVASAAPAAAVAAPPLPEKVWQVHTDPHSAFPTRSQRAASGSTSAAASSTPTCSNSHPKAFEILYARPLDVASRLGSLESMILSTLADAQQLVMDESSSAPVRLRFVCGVRDVRTNRPSAAYGADPLWTIVDDLDALGFDLTSRKYVVWWDGAPHPAACGEGTFTHNEDPDPARNPNNTGPDYAVVYKLPGQDFCGGDTALHEIGHTLGAVFPGAPNSTTNWHCYDEKDVMCYNDGSSNWRPSTQCATQNGFQHFDCNKDDYFNPSPAPGTYLATAWNVYNSSWFERLDPTPPAPPGTPQTTISSGPASAVASTSATFAFTSSMTGSTFKCSLDGQAESSCSSPKSYTGLSQGSHTFSVRATAPDGTPDETPATRTWLVDTIAPTVTMTGPSAVTQTSRNVALAWSPSDAGGVASHTIRYRSATTSSSFGGYTTWKTQSTLGATYAGIPGRTYCFSVQVKDSAGNASSWSNEKCGAVPLDDHQAWISGYWQRTKSASFYDGTVSIARGSNARMTLSSIRAKFMTARVQMCSACRYVDVYWNGRLVKKMSLYSASAKWIEVALHWMPSVQTGRLDLVVRAPVVVIDNIGVSQV